MPAVTPIGLILNLLRIEEIEVILGLVYYF